MNSQRHRMISSGKEEKVSEPVQWISDPPSWKQQTINKETRHRCKDHLINSNCSDSCVRRWKITKGSKSSAMRWQLVKERSPMKSSPPVTLNKWLPLDRSFHLWVSSSIKWSQLCLLDFSHDSVWGSNVRAGVKKITCSTALEISVLRRGTQCLENSSQSPVHQHPFVSQNIFLFI